MKPCSCSCCQSTLYVGLFFYIDDNIEPHDRAREGGCPSSVYTSGHGRVECVAVAVAGTSKLVEISKNARKCVETERLIHEDLSSLQSLPRKVQAFIKLEKL